MAGAGGGHAGANAGAVLHAWRNAQPDGLVRGKLAHATAAAAPLAPYLAAAAAAGAGTEHPHVETHDRAPERLLRRDDDIGAGVRTRRVTEKRMAHPIEHAQHRGEVDVHFVG